MATSSARGVHAVWLPEVAREGLALVLLALSLTLPWNLVQLGAQRVEIVLAVLVSAASLALPRLHARGSLPPVWTARHVRSAQLLAALPYLVCVVITLIVDAVRGFADEQGHAGIGGSLAVGLAGVLLAALPRDQLARGHGSERRRGGPATVMVTLLVVLVIASMVADLSRELPYGSLSADARVVLLAATVLVLAIPSMAVASAELGSGAGRAWTVSAVVVGVASVVAYVIGGWTRLGVLAPIQSVHLRGFGLVLLAPVAAAALASRSLARRRAEPIGERAPGSAGERGAGSQTEVSDGSTPIAAAAATAAVASAVWAVIALIRLTDLAAGHRDIPTAGLTALAVVVPVLALTTFSQLRRHLTGREHPDPLAGASAVAIAAVVLSVVSLLVIAGDVGTVVTQVDVFALALPVATAGLLLLPAAARSRVATARASRHGPPPARSPQSPPARSPQPQAPQPQVPSQPVSFLPPPGLTPGQAADPSTSPALLAAMVEVTPELRPAVAANPAASEELIARLRSFGDPGVDAVLRARGLG